MPHPARTSEERIRVLRVIARMNVGGPAVQICGLMRSLDPQRFEQVLACGSVAPGEEDFLMTQAPDVAAVRIEGLGNSKSVASSFKAARQLRQLIKSFQPDIIHTHTAKAGVLGRVVSLTADQSTRRVHTFHGHVLAGYFGPAISRGLTLTERALATRTDALIAVGPEVRDDLVRRGVGRQNQFTVIEPGVEINRAYSRESSRQFLGIQKDEVVVSFVGRLVPIKRVDRFFDALRLLQDSGIPITALVAGDGPLRLELEKTASSQGVNVRFLGWMNEPEMAFSASDLTVISSDNEGTPLSVIQAALLGVPAVATNVGSVAHLIEEGATGWLASPSSQDLARAMRDALSAVSADRDSLSENVRQSAEQRFSVHRLASQHSDVYSKLYQGS